MTNLRVVNPVSQKTTTPTAVLTSSMLFWSVYLLDVSMYPASYDKSYF